MTRRKAPLPLSFMASRESRGGYNFWNIEPSGDYATDCDVGSAAALETLEKQHSREVGYDVLRQIAIDQVANTASKGHLVGFYGVISEYVELALRVGLDLQPLRHNQARRIAATAWLKTQREAGTSRSRSRHRAGRTSENVVDLRRR